MIKKLRMKFIMISMVSLLAVLLIIEGLVGALNYRKITEDADRILGILEENKGKFPEKPPEMPPGDKGEERHGMSAEVPFESRYFSVLLDEDGTVILTDTSKIASIDTGDAIEYAAEVWNKGTEKGFLGDYRYRNCSYGSEIRMIFLDCGRQLDNFRSFIVTAIGVSALGLFSVLILMVYFSARIVKPFSDNYEKQKRFITDAGHELKTPLAIIDADAEVLEMDFGENEWLKDIQKQTKRMADLTDALVILSRMEEGNTKTMEAEFPLSDVAEEVFQAFQAPARVQGKSMSAAITPTLSMKGDEKAIRELITILLDNAVKYADENGRIELTLVRQKNRICLTVFNTTKHISKEQISRLFDRFYRTDDSRNSRTGGYGLGLSIAAATAAAHKGKITAATKDEKSLEVTVVF